MRRLVKNQVNQYIGQYPLAGLIAVEDALTSLGLMVKDAANKAELTDGGARHVA